MHKNGLQHPKIQIPNSQKTDLYLNSILMLVPVVSNSHWTLFAFFNMAKSDSFYIHYDSLHSSVNKEVETKWLDLLMEYFSFVMEKEFKSTKINPNKKVPRQNNTCDCGTFVCALAERLTEYIRHKPVAPIKLIDEIDFPEQSEVTDFRIKMDEKLKLKKQKPQQQVQQQQHLSEFQTQQHKDKGIIKKK